MSNQSSINSKSWSVGGLLKKTKGATNVGGMIRRLSDRRLVKQISAKLLEDPPEDCSVTFQESASSLGFLLTDDIEAEVSLFGSSSDLHPQSKCFLPLAPACLHRKELQVGELLGSGGFSQVFALEGLALKVELQGDLTDQEYSTRKNLARQANSGSGLAVKHINRKLLKDPNEFEAAAVDLEHEAQFLSCLNHPNIVRIRGIAMGGLTACLTTGRYNQYFVVMDRFSETLDDKLLRWNTPDSTPTSLHTKLDYAIQLASALHYLHERRCVFRDVKPENIGFLADPTTSDGERLQLFDFGLCRLLPQDQEELIKEGEAVYRMSMAGTRRYLSPEVTTTGCYNCKSDVYAWAFTLWETIAQEKPFVEFMDSRKLEWFVCQMEGRPSLRTKPFEVVPEAVKDILRSSWAHSIAQRPTMAEAMDLLRPVIQSLEQTKEDALVGSCRNHQSLCPSAGSSTSAACSLCPTAA